MAGETTITVIGALGGDPELRFTPAGAAVCNFTVATNARTYDQDAKEWKDGPTTWLNCSAWRDLAENVAESLQKGMRVIVQGHLSTREYEARDGSKRLSVELNVQAVGPDLRWATARVQRTTRGNGGGTRPRDEGGASSSGGQWSSPGGGAADPWATPSRGEEPPF